MTLLPQNAYMYPEQTTKFLSIIRNFAYITQKQKACNFYKIAGFLFLKYFLSFTLTYLRREEFEPPNLLQSIIFKTVAISPNGC